MIPNILWQTWKNKNIPDSLKKQSNSWNVSNPQLKKELMDDVECSLFIKKNFSDEVYDLYMALPQPIMRADFWRIAVLYIHGGYYSDLDIICNVSLSELIKNNPNAVFIKELNNISNFFIGATPKHPVLEKTLNYMIEESKRIVEKNVQDYGMHWLHRSVRDYYNVISTNYISDDSVFFIENETVKNQNKFIHTTASLSNKDSNYVSWRDTTDFMNFERQNTNDVLFFTTFNENGYNLYGKEWIKSFIRVSNYYTKFRAKIYYEGFNPTEEHPFITWIKYEDTILQHPKWKTEYLSKSNHTDYVKTMTVRFSHKAFVIQHALDNNNNDYLIWLDGDCVFKNSDYTNFPKNILQNKFLACQVEFSHDLNHVESGILIFDGKNSKTKKFNDEFKKWYSVDNILNMGQPYDGFLVYKSLLTSKLPYVNLNEKFGGGIQSDPNMTFLHPEIKNKFIHNIGWTGKNQYENWESIYQRDDVYQRMKLILFGNSSGGMLRKKITAQKKLEKLKRYR